MGHMTILFLVAILPILPGSSNFTVGYTITSYPKETSVSWTDTMTIYIQHLKELSRNFLFQLSIGLSASVIAHGYNNTAVPAAVKFPVRIVKTLTEKVHPVLEDAISCEGKLFMA